MKKVTAIEKIKENSTGMTALMAVLGLLCLAGTALGLGDAVYHSSFSEKKEEMAQLLSTGPVFAACAFIAAFVFSRISRTGVPFTDTAVKGLKSIAYLFFAGSFFPNVLLSVFCGKYATVNSSFIEVDMLVPSILIFCIAEFFNYGVMLQQESDETL
ncbi:MAG: hypothetical protein IJM55_00585 [Ruminococcus sp.]|nr:hypothetical protein [Ruminococcus sp.]